MEAYDRFELLINDRIVKTPVAIASMAGIVDAAYVLERAEHVGAAFIGGYSIDPPTMEASRQMAAAGRKEFLYDDPLEALGREIAAIQSRGDLLCRERPEWQKDFCALYAKCRALVGVDE